MNKVPDPSTEPEIGSSYKLMAGLKAMKTPDPSNEPQTPDLSKIDKAMAGLEAAALRRSILQPTALARLEAWLAEDDCRSVTIERECSMLSSEWEIVLRSSDERKSPVYGYECGDHVDATKCDHTSIAEAPGLAATIDAALEKAGEVKL